MRFQKILESSGIFFAALLVFAVIAFAAFTTWPPGGDPQADPGEGNVKLAIDYDEDGIIDWLDWDDTDPEKLEEDLLPENVKKDVDIFGVVGSMEPVSPESPTRCRVPKYYLSYYDTCSTPSAWCELGTNCSASCNCPTGGLMSYIKCTITITTYNNQEYGHVIGRGDRYCSSGDWCGRQWGGAFECEPCPETGC